MGSGRLTMIIVTVVIGLLGLVLSSRAADEAFYWIGIVVFVAAVLALFGLIGRSGEQNDR